MLSRKIYTLYYERIRPVELKIFNHNSRVTSDGGDSIRIVVRQDSYSFLLNKHHI